MTSEEVTFTAHIKFGIYHNVMAYETDNDMLTM